MLLEALLVTSQALLHPPTVPFPRRGSLRLDAQLGPIFRQIPCYCLDNLEWFSRQHKCSGLFLKRSTWLQIWSGAPFTVATRAYLCSLELPR